MSILSISFTILIVLVGLFLSLWVVIPAPILALMPLSVGAPEVSATLIAVNSLGMGLSLLLFRFSAWRVSHPSRLLIILGLSSLALILSSLPIGQFAAVQQQADREIVQALGADYQAKIPAALQAQWRSRPLSWLDCFRGIATRPIRETVGIPFASPDGVPLKINLYQPEKPGQYPAIITIYGGAWQRGNPGQDAAFNRYMAAQGYVVWAIDYRHAPKYQFPTQLTDVRSALQFIQQNAMQYETDLTRVAVMGRSAGAQLASLVAYQPGAFPVRAMVNYYGPADLTAGYWNLPTPDPIDVRSTLRKYLGGTPDEFPEPYRQASPINAVGPNRPASLLIYGAKDHIIRPAYGESLTAALRAENNTVAMITIPWADHSFDAVFYGVSNQLALYYTERFLAAQLYGD